MDGLIFRLFCNKPAKHKKSRKIADIQENPAPEQMDQVHEAYAINTVHIAANTPTVSGHFGMFILLEKILISIRLR